MGAENHKAQVIYQTLYRLCSIIVPVITAPYVARVLGKNGVGIYSYTHSLASYFVIFAKLGIELYGNRTVARIRDAQEALNRCFRC